jgi:hypothetical protein
MITVVWDTWRKPGTEEEGPRLTRQVWSDMRSFDGYVSHQIFIDQDASGHIIALANWQSRADADAVREKYNELSPARRLLNLTAQARFKRSRFSGTGPLCGPSLPSWLPRPEALNP